MSQGGVVGSGTWTPGRLVRRSARRGCAGAVRRLRSRWATAGDRLEDDTIRLGPGTRARTVLAWWATRTGSLPSASRRMARRWAQAAGTCSAPPAERAVAEEVALLQGHSTRVHALVFSPDGQTLASGSGRRRQRRCAALEGQTPLSDQPALPPGLSWAIAGARLWRLIEPFGETPREWLPGPYR